MDKEQVFKELFAQYRPQVYRLCRGYFGSNHAMAEDAVQEVFMNVWRHLDLFRHEAQLSTWLYRITVNTCLLFLRREARKRESYTDKLPAVAEEASTTPEQEAQLQRLYQCIARLPDTDRMTILLVLEGMSYAQIAGVLGIREDTLRVRIHRIKKTLIQCVNNGTL